jgi:hypothetical protein
MAASTVLKGKFPGTMAWPQPANSAWNQVRIRKPQMDLKHKDEHFPHII